MGKEGRMPVRIDCVLGDRVYEAVSFTEPGESADGDTMIARTDGESGGGIGEEDGQYFWDHRSEWPEELKRHPLVCTKWRDPDGPRHVRYFYWYDDVWCQFWFGLGDQWHGTVLVLRRRM